MVFTSTSKKHLWKSDILNKDPGHQPTSLLKMLLFHGCFPYILPAKTNICFSIIGTLAGHGLNERVKQVGHLAERLWGLGAIPWKVLLTAKPSQSFDIAFLMHEED